MAITIQNHFVEDFKSDVIHLVQQEDSRIFSKQMNIRMETGEVHTFPRISRRGIDLVAKLGARTDTAFQDTIYSNRTVDLAQFNTADSVESHEMHRMLTDSSKQLPKEISAQVNRFKDKICYDALIGDANTVTGVTGSARTRATVTLPASQTVGKDVGAADSALTMRKLNNAKSIFEANEVIDEKLYLVTNAAGLEALREDVRATNHEYQSAAPLTTGDLGMLLGFEIVLYNFLDGSGESATPFKSVAFTNKALGLAMNPLVDVRVDERVDQQYMWQWYAELRLAAVRLEEEQVVVIEHLAAS